ncbi:MAG: InlB B-repeat-containing protein [Coriobacteriales bacterium]|nr:InlB B-repeat-containing protein [Coriobacteriales bacterium]
MSSRPPASVRDTAVRVRRSARGNGPWGRAALSVLLSLLLVFGLFPGAAAFAGPQSAPGSQTALGQPSEQTPAPEPPAAGGGSPSPSVPPVTAAPADPGAGAPGSQPPASSAPGAGDPPSPPPAAAPQPPAPPADPGAGVPASPADPGGTPAPAPPADPGASAPLVPQAAPAPAPQPPAPSLPLGPQAATATTVSTQFHDVRIGGSLADPDTSSVVKTGDSSLMRYVFTVTTDGTVEPQRFAFRVCLDDPKGLISVSPNSNYTLVRGGLNGPADTTDSPGRYWWVQWKAPFSGTYTAEVQLNVTPFENFVTADKAQSGFVIQPFDMGGAAPKAAGLPYESSATGAVFVAQADSWAFGDATTTTAPTHVIRPGAYGTASVPGLRITLSAQERAFDAAAKGRAYTDTVNLAQNFVVPTDKGGEPLVLIAPADLRDAGGSPLPASAYAATYFASPYDGYLKDFTLKGTVRNPTLGAQDPGDLVPDAPMGTASLTFAIQGARYNKALIETLFNGADTSQTPSFGPFYLTTDPTAVAGMNNAAPNVAVSPLASASGPQPTYSQGSPLLIGAGARANAFAFVYDNQKRPTEDASRTFRQHAFVKAITRIADIPSKGTLSEEFGALSGNLVRYQLGQDIRNEQQRSLDSLTITEGGFDPLYLNPRVLHPGTYARGPVPDAAAKLRVVIREGTSSRVQEYTDFKGTLPDLTIADPSKVTSIELVYTDIEPGFSFRNGPEIDFQVADNIPDSMENEKIVNSATASYAYTPENSTQQVVTAGKALNPRHSPVASFRYKKVNDLIGRYSFNKTGDNVTRPGAFPAAGDQLSYRVNLRNATDANMHIGRFVDTLYGLQSYVDDPRNVRLLLREFDASGKPTGAPSVVTDTMLKDLGWINDGQTLADILTIKNEARPATGARSGTLTITPVKADAHLPPRSKLDISYQTVVRPGFSAADPKNRALQNRFVLYAPDGVTVLGKGRAGWALSDASQGPGVVTKRVVNASPGYVGQNPVPGDVMLFTIDVWNTTGSTLKGFMVRDSYFNPGVFLPHGDLSGIDPQTPLPGSAASKAGSGYAALVEGRDSTKPLHISDANARAVNLAIVDTSGLGPASTISGAGVTASPVDLRKGIFEVYFPTSCELAPGDKFTIAYTLRTTEKTEGSTGAVRPEGGDTAFNSFELLDLPGRPVGSGAVTLEVDAFLDKVGQVSVLKSVKLKEGTGSLGNLSVGDRLTYSIDVSSYHTRNNTGKAVHVSKVIDDLPRYLVPDLGSVKVYDRIIQGSSESLSETAFPWKAHGTPPTPDDDPSDAALTPANARLTVDFSPSCKLESGHADNNHARHHLVVTFDAKVDADPSLFPPMTVAATGANLAEVTAVNKATAVLDEGANDLYVINGTNPSANDYTYASQTGKGCHVSSHSGGVVIKNSQYGELAVSKKVVGGAGLDLSGSASLRRDYTVTITNSALSPVPLDALVDLLPRYERLDTAVTPQIKLVKPGIDPATAVSSDLAYTLMPDFTEQGRGFASKRVRFDNPGTLAAATKAGSAISSSKALITYSTVIDANDRAAARQDFRSDDVNASAYENQVGVYVSKPQDNIKPGAGASLVTEDDTNNWFGSPEDGYRYRITSKAGVTLTDQSLAPFVGLAPYTIVSTTGQPDKLKAYVQSSSLFPHSELSLKVDLGNSSVTKVNGVPFRVTTMAPGAHLVVELPEHLTYQGFQVDDGKAGAHPVPTYLDGLNGEAGHAPTVLTGGGRTWLVWKVNRSFDAGAGTDFYLRIGTGGAYMSYAVNAYLVPLQDAGQFFYDKLVESSDEFRHRFDFMPDTMDLSAAGVPGLAGPQHLVRTNAGFYTFGDLGIDTVMQVKQLTGAGAGRMVSTQGGNRTLTVSDRDESFAYTMALNVRSSTGRGVRNPVFINRLPSVGDVAVRSGSHDARGSEATARLAGTDGLGDVTVDVVNASGVRLAGFDPKDWKVGFCTAPATTAFDASDWSGADNGRWAGTVPDPSAVTALRVARTSTSGPDFELPPGYSLKVTATAKLHGYAVPLRTALDSFAFDGYIGTGKHPTHVNAEVLPLGVRADVPYDRAVITKVLDDPTPSPRMTGPYLLDLIGIDRDDSSQTKVMGGGPYGLKVEKAGDGRWSQRIEVDDLPRTMRYTAVETNNPAGFKDPVVDVKEVPGPAGSTLYEITVTNAPNLHTVRYDANGGTGSQSDPQTYYRYDKAQVKGAGTVSRDGYDFLGWNTRPNGSGTAHRPGSRLVLDDTVTLYAQWAPVPPPPPGAPLAPGAPVVPPRPPAPPAPAAPTPLAPPCNPLCGQAGAAPCAFGSPTSSARADTPAPAPAPAQGKGQGQGQGSKQASKPKPPVSPGTAADATDACPSDDGFGMVPLGDFGLVGAWSLLSLVLSLVALVLSAVLLLTLLRRRRRQDKDATGRAARGATGRATASVAQWPQARPADDGVPADASLQDGLPDALASAPASDGEEDGRPRERRYRLRALKVVAACAGILVAVLFLLLDDMRLPMVWVNCWTPLIGAVFLLHLVLAIVQCAVKRPRTDDDVDADSEQA